MSSEVPGHFKVDGEVAQSQPASTREQLVTNGLRAVLGVLDDNRREPVEHRDVKGNGAAWHRAGNGILKSGMSSTGDATLGISFNLSAIRRK